MNVPNDPTGDYILSELAVYPDVSSDDSALVAPYAQGACHLNLQQNWIYTTDAQNPDTYQISATLYDSAGTQIGAQPFIGSGDANPTMMVSKLENPLRITPEQTNDYIQFNYANQNWQSGTSQFQWTFSWCNTQSWTYAEESAVSCYQDAMECL
jgi:predicted acyl esterase